MNNNYHDQRESGSERPFSFASFLFHRGISPRRAKTNTAGGVKPTRRTHRAGTRTHRAGTELSLSRGRGLARRHHAHAQALGCRGERGAQGVRHAARMRLQLWRRRQPRSRKHRRKHSQRLLSAARVTCCQPGQSARAANSARRPPRVRAQLGLVATLCAVIYAAL